MKLHVFPPSPNAKKTIFANAYFDTGAEIVVVDIQTGVQKSPEFLALNPNGRIPVLEFDDGTTLWESNAIVNRLAAEVDTEAWPKSNDRYDIMRWQYWSTAHWQPACGAFIAKHLFGDDSIDLDAATKTFEEFATVLDDHLGKQEWLVGNGMTTADICVAPYLYYRDPCHIPMNSFSNVQRWITQMESQPAWESVKT